MICGPKKQPQNVDVTAFQCTNFGLLSLYRHETRRITFCLVVDDFAIKHFGADDKTHL